MARKPKGKIHGIGINDANYKVSVKINGRVFKCPIYQVWKGIVLRTTSKYQKAKPRYAGVTLDPRWISFMAFRAWYIIHHNPGYQVDKDLISDAKVYGPDTCVMVPQWLNLFFGGLDTNNFNQKKAGTYRLAGHKNYYTSSPGISLGTFVTQRQAHYAWRKEKRRIAKSRKAEMDAIDKRIYPRILKILKGL